MSWFDGPAPRDHAIKILRLPKLEQRRQYLDKQVDPRLRDLVSMYVKDWWPRRREIRKQQDD